jgi:hypothetical protein
VPAEVVALARAGMAIAAIKLYRELTGAGLREAKAVVESCNGIGWLKPAAYQYLSAFLLSTMTDGTHFQSLFEGMIEAAVGATQPTRRPVVQDELDRQQRVGLKMPDHGDR